MPILFKQCYLNYSPQAMPPEVIRAHVRRVTYYGMGRVRITTPYATSLRTYLNVLPNVVHIRLLGIYGGPSADLMNLCLEKASSLDIEFSSHWTPMPSDLPSGEHYTSRNSLTHFQYDTNTFRELLSVRIPWGFRAEYAMETRSLARLVFDMHITAESLSLPMETAPLSLMQDLEWSRIRCFSLYGRYELLSPPGVSSLPAVLSRMSSLRILHVQARQHPTLTRAPILGRSPHVLTEMMELRSLTLAYPDPEDAIFRVNAPFLTCLSLRDEPRRYLEPQDPDYAAVYCPLLKASECLYILRKFATPALESLELVYEADDGETDLLRHLSSHYSRLARLELHRYQARNDKNDVPYTSITTVLTSITPLKSLHLNLGTREMPPVRCNDFELCKAWAYARDARAQEILTIMRRCPNLEYVAMLDPRYQCCTWVEYRPTWYPGSYPPPFRVEEGRYTNSGVETGSQ
ncbi:hypothetical protein GY45DRAFT_1327542 [Cubamyces sp. BRFM 1775]|nr:hypothetical protein GY45DRAFT_1327542 [Cubamyces sp. BRFM 1775]